MYFVMSCVISLVRYLMGYVCVLSLVHQCFVCFSFLYAIRYFVI